ncbi:hypothetical protein FB567DRAFT_553426 [Paraphoma chrysanthemicola]|uniref:RanBP2-type domain-containing protein n=1 Tax=Paraphoma chrysanthemicola TaxID=798071 RepID=A0A8K0QYL4_9PLEO|nr:hypothetical protein FB567DRAFT_553426 [Paraphoma chrysanthemicola]
MAWPAPNPIPLDMWMGHECKAGNLIELAPQYCGQCTHPRCGWCYGPGEQQPDQSGFRPGHPELSNAKVQHVYDGHCGHSGYFHQSPNISDEHAGSYDTDFDDLWHCYECNADNGDWCDRCPLCGADRPADDHARAPPSFAIMGGAGSTAPGTWVCEECGCPNSEVCVACGQCGASK